MTCRSTKNLSVNLVNTTISPVQNGKTNATAKVVILNYFRHQMNKIATNKTKKKEELILFQIRCAEAEKALEDCAAAFELLPIWALERGQNWVPSEVAIRLLKKAKGSVTAYSTVHWHTNSSG